MDKKWLIIGTVLVLAGMTLFASVMMICGWDFTKLSTVKYETNVHEIKDEFHNISISVDTADILFVASGNGVCTVECREEENLYHTVYAQDGELKVQTVNQRKWYEYIGIHFGTPKITVYLPEGEYGALSIRSDTGDTEIPEDYTFESMDISVSTGDVVNYASVSNAMDVQTSTGNILVESVSAASLNLSVSTGRITLSDAECSGDLGIHVSTGKTNMTNVRCGNLQSEGDTGDISMKNVIASENLFITRSTGDVTFERCDAAEIYVNTDTGDVRGSLLSDKVFMVQTDTGKVIVPESNTGGKCEVISSTGDIKLDVQD